MEEALGTGLIIESPPVPGGFRFTHAITRQTLYDDLSQARRLRMHLRTGEAIEGVSLDENESVLPELAYHFSISASLNSQDKAINYSKLAGKQAMRSVAYSEASSYFQQAIDALELDSSAFDR